MSERIQRAVLRIGESSSRRAVAIATRAVNVGARLGRVTCVDIAEELQVEEEATRLELGLSRAERALSELEIFATAQGR
ncbi:MAG: hypothetical protein NTV49_05385 [Kiritimatiellaeota bacterium]|nr:hypothetical protein [Kiritimatiellota bacterium]